MRPAIPLSINLYFDESLEFIKADDVLVPLSQSFKNLEIDADRGKREVLARRDELLSMGAPEVLVVPLLVLANQTYSVTVHLEDWLNNSLSGHVSDMDAFQGQLSFKLQHNEFSFAKSAAHRLGSVLNTPYFMQSKFNYSVDTNFYPKQTDATNWIRQYYAKIDKYRHIYDPVTETDTPLPPREPILQELHPWQPIIQNAVIGYLTSLRQVNSQAITAGFPSYRDYAAQYVLELSEFASLKHCWSVDLDESHHNQALIEYEDWLALVNLSGVPTGLFGENAPGTTSSRTPTDDA